MGRFRELLVAGGVGAGFVALIFFSFITNARDLLPSISDSNTKRDLSSTSNDFKAERNRLSKLLNDMKKAYGRLSCESIKLKQKAGEKVEQSVAESGGWCYDQSKPQSSKHLFDTAFASALLKVFSGKSVASFGDGPGEYKRFMDKTNKLKVYDAYDGAPYCEIVTNNTVKFLDLTAPQYGLPVYDWVSSVEVAEHIPAKYQDIYLDNIVRHAREGILLSWAVPGQGGFYHVNLKSAEDVKSLMRTRGFEVDMAISKELQTAAKLPWLKNNALIYRRQNSMPFNAANT